MEFITLVEHFERLEATSKRLDMFDILSELLASADANEIAQIIYLSQGVLLPPFYGIEMGMSEKLLGRAISSASNTATATVESMFKLCGDMGTVAEELIRGKPGLSVVDVYQELDDIAKTSGKGSVEKKIGLLSSLFKGVSSKEAKYIARFVIGRLRLGIGDPTVLESLAKSIGDRSLRGELERAYNLCSDLGLVAKTIKEKGVEGIRGFKVQVGFPIRMALCERLTSSIEIINRLGRAAIEAKYDGFRCQIHKNGQTVDVFSRNLERTTLMFPEITEAVRKHIDSENAILEGEALAYNETTGELLPFQVTIQRKRKHGIEELSKECPLKFFAFELLYSDGNDYTEKPYIERRNKLVGIIKKNPVIEPAEMFETNDPLMIDKYFEETIVRGLEGIIAKRLDSIYTAGARNFNWIKLKRSYKGELADSVDVAIVGYFSGKGARARFGLGAVLGAVYDPSSDSFKSISKIGSGFSDEEFYKLKELLDESRITHKHPRVDCIIEADVWVKPLYVITVTADEITRSTLHTAGRDGKGIGYALRFPRIAGFIRADKRPEDANTVNEIMDMFNMQKKVTIS